MNQGNIPNIVANWQNQCGYGEDTPGSEARRLGGSEARRLGEFVSVLKIHIFVGLKNYLYQFISIEIILLQSKFKKNDTFIKCFFSFR